MAYVSHVFLIMQRGCTALQEAASSGHLEIATLIISKACEQGKLTRESFENMSLNANVRDDLLFVFNKAMRRHDRCQILWMSSIIVMDDSNILSLLPLDLSKYVSNFV